MMICCIKLFVEIKIKQELDAGFLVFFTRVHANQHVLTANCSSRPIEMHVDSDVRCARRNLQSLRLGGKSADFLDESMYGPDP